MQNYSFDIIFIIILALLVAFIIGFNILQLIDNKLTNININLPNSFVDRIVDKNNDTHFYIKNYKEVQYTNQYETFDNTNTEKKEIVSPLLPEHNIDNSSNDSQNNDSQNNNSQSTSASSDNDSIYLNCNIKMVTQNNSPLLKLDDQKSMDTINVDGFDKNSNLALI